MPIGRGAAILLCMPYLKTLTAGPIETNAYLIGADSSDRAVLIDAPPESYPMITAHLRDEGRSLEAVLITHSHFDHVIDLHRFAEDGIKIFAHADALNGIEHPDSFGFIPEPPQGFTGASVDTVIRGGEVLTAAGLQFRVLEVPGHGPGSVAFLLLDASICFVGDLIFRGSVGRTDIPGADFDELSSSIRNQIYTLDEAVRLFPGHGGPTDVGTEKRSNPFVRG